MFTAEKQLIRFVMDRFAADRMPSEKQLEFAVEDYYKQHEVKSAYYDEEYGWRLYPYTKVTTHEDKNR